MTAGDRAAGAGTSTSVLADRWRDELAAWAIPPEILAAVPDSPWVLPERMFARRADRQLEHPVGPSFALARAALPNAGTVLDVGAGAGAAGLPLARLGAGLTAVDSHGPLLAALGDRAAAYGLAVTTVRGVWPEVADGVPPADVVVCHHVLYNAPDLVPFVLALTRHARARVVVEMTARHPLTTLGPLWLRFHGLERPTGPTADDALALVESLGLDVAVERWTRPRVAEHATFADVVDITRRRLCLPVERADEVAAALREQGEQVATPVDLGSSGEDLVTLAWPGPAPADRGRRAAARAAPGEAGRPPCP